jgi:Dephospho-CoA kinase
MNKIIGITGLIGTGKSTLMNLLKKKLNNDFIYIDVDNYRRKLVTEKDDIVEILNLKNKSDLNRVIYNDKDKMKIFKKYIYDNLLNDFKTDKNIIVEWALLIDDNLDKYCDYVFIMDCEEEMIINRLKDGDLGIIEIKRRLRLQLPINKKVKLLSNSNYQVIDTSEEIEIALIVKKIKEVCYEL